MITKLNSKKDLEVLRKKLTKKNRKDGSRITICGGTGCHAYGCTRVTDAFKNEVAKQGIANKVDIKITGCHGFCEKGPLVVIRPGDLLYQRVKPEDVPEILDKTITGNSIVERLLNTDPTTGRKKDYPQEKKFNHKQKGSIYVN